MSAPNGSITDFYPGTFNARSARSFLLLFDEIHRRVIEIVYHGQSPSKTFTQGDTIELLSGHRVPIIFKLPSGKTELRYIKLENIPPIDERTRLLLLDMMMSLETPFVIDRLSQMALSWPDFVFRLDQVIAIVINPQATQRMFTRHRDPASFLNLVNASTVRSQVKAPTSFGDVIIELYTAAQYALARASFEPVIPSGFPNVLRVRFGLRVCVVGITAADAYMFGPATTHVIDITNRRFGRLLVPGLYA